jgi:GT2 family glycosyltransferase
MGTRPAELARALTSVLGQREVDLDVVVVGNGWRPAGLPSGVRVVELEDNVGIPAGRNVGADNVKGDLLFFFDDDAELPDGGMLAAAEAQFAADPRLGVLQPRSVDPQGRPTARRHIPRLRVADPERAGDVAWFWEGCCLVRRSLFERVGRWPGSFWYAHEGIELAWRAVDEGYRIRYAAELVVLHPAVPPSRHAEYRYMNARNRIWVARRNLPYPVLVGYVAVWTVLTFMRIRRWGDAVVAARGFLDGIREPAGERRPISWRAVWRLTRLGRPPVV